MTRRFRPPPPDRPYDVGYGKPPVSGRFAKGQSGNPRGRPKGARRRKVAPAYEGLEDIILCEAYRDITVADGDKQLTIPMAQAVMRSISIGAAKGQSRAQRLFTMLVGRVELRKEDRRLALLEEAVNYKIAWERELERRAKHGVVGPDPLPHPDDVIIDPDTATVRVLGPMTKEDKLWLDEVLKYLHGLQAEFADEAAESEAEKSRGSNDDAAFSRKRAIECQRNYERLNSVIWPRYRKPLQGRLSLTPEEQSEVDRKNAEALKRIQSDETQPYLEPRSPSPVNRRESKS